MKTNVNTQGTNVDVFIRKAREVTLAITVTGISDWTNLEAKFYYSKTQPDAAAEEIDCTITIAENKVTLVFEADDTKDLSDFYYYDLIVYNTTTDWQKDIMYGKLIIGNVVKAVVI